MGIDRIMRVIIADDHPLYLESVQRQLARAYRNAEICAFSRFSEALAAMIEQPADLVMLDYTMPGFADEDMKQAIASAGSAPVVVMSGVASAKDVAACIAAGAKGFLPKTMDGRVFTDAVAVVLHGGTYLPAEFIGVAFTSPSPSAVEPGEPVETTKFNARERDLLQMVVAGATNKEIARKLALQEVTVKFYLTRLFRRLGVKNRSQAAVVVVRSGLFGGE